VAAPPSGPVTLLLHEDDLHPESLTLAGLRVQRVIGLCCPRARSPLGAAPLVQRFVAGGWKMAWAAPHSISACRLAAWRLMICLIF
jgi:hypothetical protein